MKITEKELTQELLKECFSYHEEGYLVWKTRPSYHFNNSGNAARFNTQLSGKIVGYFNKRTDSKKKGFGYWRAGITFKGLGYDEVGHFKLHRLIFAFHYGYFPEVVDHKDRNTNNNKISNLRPSTVGDNSKNLDNAVNNSTGYKGVTLTNRKKKPYKAAITCNWYCFGLGSYSTIEEAAYAYNVAAKELFKEYSCLNDVNFKPESIFFREYLPSIKEGTFDYNKLTKRVCGRK